MAITLRRIERAELAKFAEAQAVSFGSDFHPEMVDKRDHLFEYDRNTAAFDGDDIVGTAGIFSFEMTVPGGPIPVAGVTMVSVQPTHRRRGVLTAMMTSQLGDIRERGEAVAALWASESPIYGRFGYGLSSQNADVTIAREWTELRDGPVSAGSVRLVTTEQASATWPAVHERIRAGHTGFYSHPQAWWDDRVLSDPEFARGGATHKFLAEYREDGEVRGYLVYRISGSWKDWLPDRTLEVSLLIAETPAAYAALWRYVFGVDLIARIEARERSVDEPLYWMVTDPRRLERRLHDALWIRIVDVQGALAGRRYATAGSVVIEVHDAVLEGVGGRFVVEGGPEGALCKPTTRDADVRMGIRELGALYLGAHSSLPLAAAGRIEGAPGKLRELDAMFRWSPPAWCPEVF